MKKILLAFSILFSITLYGQAPQAMNAFPYIYGATGYKNNSVDSNVVNFFGVKQGGNGKMVATPSFVSPKAISIGNGNTTGTSSIAIGNSISVSDSSIGLGSSSAKHQMVLGNNTIDSSYIYGHTVIQNGLSLPTIQNATGLATDANGNVIQSSSIIETGGNYGTFFNTQTAAPLGFIGVSKGMGTIKKSGKFAFINSVFDGTSLGSDTVVLAYGVFDTTNPANSAIISIDKINLTDTTFSINVNAKNIISLNAENGINFFDSSSTNSKLYVNGLPTGSASDTFVVMEGNQMKKRIGGITEGVYMPTITGSYADSISVQDSFYYKINGRFFEVSGIYYIAFGGVSPVTSFNTFFSLPIAISDNGTALGYYTLNTITGGVFEGVSQSGIVSYDGTNITSIGMLPGTSNVYIVSFYFKSRLD